MPVVEINNVSKRYRIQGMHYKTFREDVNAVFTRIAGKQREYSEDRYIWALKDVSFHVEQGEVLGVIGPNGAGKSTILKILSRVTTPTSGAVRVNGRFVSLIELGAGFHPELSGRENVYMNGIILGMNKKEIDRKFDDIVAFSEIEKFIDTPVKHYSSGMFLRLAFAVMAHSEPEILLVDEILAVGDLSFRDKCLKKMREFRETGKTLIVVSHDMRIIENLCRRAVLLQGGRVLDEGETRKVVNSYHSHVDATRRVEARRNTGLDSGSKDLEIISVDLVDEAGNEREQFKTGEKMTARVTFRTNRPVEKPAFGINLYSDFNLILGMHNAMFEQEPSFPAGHVGRAELTYENLNLLSGQYYIEAFVLKDVFSDFDTAYDVADKKYFSVASPVRLGVGTLFLNTKFRFADNSD